MPKDMTDDTAKASGIFGTGSKSRASEQRRVDRVWKAVADIVGPEEAIRLVEEVEAHRDEFERRWFEENRRRLK